MLEQYLLPNGIQVILVPLHDTPSVTTMILYPVGSRHEPEKLSGVSHYIEHIMFKGTKKRPSSLVLTREIDRLGAEYNAFTGKEYTGYYIKTAETYTETALDILSDMLFNSSFLPKEMEKEKGVIVEEIKMYNDNPVMNIDTVFEQLMYKGALSRDIAGTEKHVRSYKREDVLKYKNRHYQPANMILVMAGSINDGTKQMLRHYFGKQKNTRRHNGSFKPAEFGSVKRDNRVAVHFKQTDQAQLMLGFPGFSCLDRKNTAIMSILNTILGGSMSSRLFVQIRERRGLAYMVRAGMEQFKDSGYSYIRAGLDAKNINKAIKVIEKELEKIKEKGVKKQELLDAKTHIRGSITLALENSSAIASRYARQALFLGQLITPEESFAQIDRVTNSDIKKMAKKIFRKKQMRVAAIGQLEPSSIRI